MHLSRVMLRAFMPVCWLVVSASCLAWPTDSIDSADCYQRSLPIESCPEPWRHGCSMEEMPQCLHRRVNAVSRLQGFWLLPKVCLKVAPVPLPTGLPKSVEADLVSLGRTWQFRCHAAKPPRAPSRLSWQPATATHLAGRRSWTAADGGHPGCVPVLIWDSDCHSVDPSSQGSEWLWVGDDGYYRRTGSRIPMTVVGLPRLESCS